MPRYGFFDSLLSAADAVTAGLEYGQLHAREEGLYWVEFRPLEGGRNVLVHRNWQGDIACLTPPGFNVRSGVYEYGGKSWCKLKLQVAFINAADQQIWLLNDELPNQQHSPLSNSPPETLSTSKPQQLTHQADCRYGDLLYDHFRQCIIAVQEQATADPTQPRHSLVSISIETGKVTQLASGDDFYAAPTLSADGHRFAWLSWDHPHMPWVSTRLNSAQINAKGELEDKQVLAGGSYPEAIQQPRFMRDNSLVAVSDKTGWWNLYRYLLDDKMVRESGGLNSYSGLKEGQSDQSEPLWPRENDFGIPQWQMGVYTWDELIRTQQAGDPPAEKRWVASYMERGEGRLVIGSASMQEQRIAKEYSLFRHVCSFNDKVYCIATSKNHAGAIIEITPDSSTHEAVQVIAGGQLPVINVDLPQPITYPVGDESAYGFLYLPKLLAPSESAGADSKPPLLVFTHGGPTGATYPVYSPKIQFWVSRGFAVVDLNYRGSTGYGRDYRLRLAGSWGETDWQDAVAAVDYLAERELIDLNNVFIRGGSAGGYTTLCALAYSEHFKGGASYYGVSDPVALTRDTHKFESHYLDWLIGDPEQDAELYLQRSPLEHADQINCSMIFFQGGKDRVVVPQQTEVMVNALKRQNIPVEYHLYPDEQHGFRQAENQIHSLEAELAFYRGLLT